MATKPFLDKLRRVWTKTPTQPVAPPAPVADVKPPIAARAKPLFAPKPVDPAFRAEMARHIDYLCANVPSFREQLERERAALDWWECLPPECYQDKDVLDLGCGKGAGVATFLERGARFVWGVDPSLDAATVQKLSVLPRAKFTAAEITADLVGPQRFDLVYAQFVTEHLRHVPSVLDTIFALLKPGGRFVALHDNYYSPMGGHDHAYLGSVPDEPQRIHFKGVRCWESPLKCAASEEAREESERVYGWLATLNELKPDDCSLCPYFQRSHVWAHLLFQDFFAINYMGNLFFATRCDGGVNKVTPFQLRQFLIEAGFAVTTWQPNKVANEPPIALAERFSVNDLQTATILFAAEKPLPGAPRWPLPRAA